MNINNKDILVYGIGRIQRDFEYMFPRFNIKGYIVENEEQKKDSNLKLYELNQLDKNILKNTKIIICKKKDEYITNKFINLGLKEKKHFYWLEDIGTLLDNKYDEFVEILIELYLKYIKRWGNYKKNYIRNSELFKKIIYSDSYDGPFCPSPFRYASIQPDGFVYTCCPSYAYNKAGNLFFKRADKIWNSNFVRLHRLSILNRTYALCDRNLCPYLSKKLSKTTYFFNNVKEEAHPNEVYVAIDKSCNLKCKSCRKEFYSAKGLSRIYIYVLAKRLIKSSWLEKSKKLIMAGQGEVFFSKFYDKLLYDEKTVKRGNIIILTNATLLNKHKLDKLCSTYNHIKIYISIDAATEKTYKKLRVGGNFNNLMKNLEYISQMRQNNKIEEVVLFYVVQKENYKEMIEFTKLAKKLKFDGINFSQITDWGTYTSKQFKKVSMMNEQGEPKRELKKVLKNIIFKDKIVNLTNITKFIEEK